MSPDELTPDVVVWILYTTTGHAHVERAIVSKRRAPAGYVTVTAAGVRSYVAIGRVHPNFAAAMVALQAHAVREGWLP